MKFTRQHGVLRILIGCLNWTKIPKHFPLKIKDGFYDLTFDVEGEERIESEDMDTDDQQNHKPDDDGDLGDDFKEVLENWTSKIKKAVAKMEMQTRDYRKMEGGRRLRLQLKLHH